MLYYTDKDSGGLVEIKEDDNKLIDTVESAGGLKIEIWSSDFQHALDGHPEVTLSRIQDVLKSPMQVIQSKKSSNACLFYSAEIQDPKLGTIYFCAVVRVLGDGKGKLETAYEADYVKTGTILFPQRGKK